jgi:protein involved in polysaccharide export with SLBB domain
MIPTFRAMRLLPALLLLVLSAIPVGLSGQLPVQLGASGAELSREELTELLHEYEAAATSSAYSGGIRDAARANAAMIRERLEHGDFHAGDRVALYVQGEPNLPDTVLVEPGPQITLPLFGSISLAGVLRSEIQEHLTQELGKIIHEPVVRAQGLMRLSIQGAVGRPGFYVVPADLLVQDALMMAGGPAGDANLEKIRIERGTDRILEGQMMQEAMREGRTLDQLSLQAGDQVYLPRKTSGITGQVIRYGVIIASTLLLGVRIVR